MSRNHLSVGYVLSLGIVLAARTAAGPNGVQITGNESSDPVDLQRKAESALDRVQHNDVGQGIVDATYYVEVAAHVDPRRAIPVLEAYFARAPDPDLRSEIASVLVSIGDENPQFWNLILNQAQAALKEDPPDPFEMGQAGESSAPCSSEAFLNWAKSRNLTPNEACKEATLGFAEKLRPLADSGDRRGIPILEEALKSRSLLIQMMAARGLVLTGDREAATRVIEAIDHAPQDRARALADSLIESDDPRAQSVVHRYLSDVNFPEAHKFRAQNGQWRRPILAGR
jgi:HEAT repeat protein